MKTLILIATLSLFTTITNAQSINYNMEMQSAIKMLDTAKTKNGYFNTINNFKKIAISNEKEWLPQYYIAYCNLVLGIRIYEDEETKDNTYDTAISYINKADTLSPNNSEVYALKGYITFMQMAVSPQQRAMKMIPESNTLIAKSITLNPENPRAYLLKGQNTYYTPEMFGGGKDDAKPILIIAHEKFEKFKPKTLEPNWGKTRCEELLKSYN